jgi:hypothetical protein
MVRKIQRNYRISNFTTILSLVLDFYMWTKMNLMNLRRVCSQIFVPKRNLIGMLQVPYYLTLLKKFCFIPKRINSPADSFTRSWKSVSWTTLPQPKPKSLYLISTLIFFFYLWQIVSSLQGFIIKSFTYSFSLKCTACSAHLVHLDQIAKLKFSVQIT